MLLQRRQHDHDHHLFLEVRGAALPRQPDLRHAALRKLARQLIAPECEGLGPSPALDPVSHDTHLVGSSSNGWTSARKAAGAPKREEPGPRRKLPLSVGC